MNQCDELGCYCPNCDRSFDRAALAASRVEVAEEKVAHQGTREALESCVASENALKADVERLTLHATSECGLRVEATDAVERLAGALERARGEMIELAEAAESTLGRHARGFSPLLKVRAERARAFLAPPTPIATPGTSPREKLLVYCELAESEIPNFGTDRDTHRCAKMHHRTPWPVHATPGTPTEEET